MAETTRTEQFSALPALITVKQAAAILNCSRRTVTDMCNSGKLEHCRVGSNYRVNRDALLEYAGLH